MHGVLQYIILLVFILFNLNTIFAERPSSFLTLHFQYTGDFVGNVSGGIRQGFSYLGLANLTLLVDTKKAKAWKGGYFFVNLADTHGSMPSNNLIGDYQGISNIEAGNHFMLYECWYQQQFGATSMTIGIQDLNASFMTNDAGNSFINSSFALPPSFSANFPAPIFPHTAVGILIQSSINKTPFHWNAAIYDGTTEECNESLHSFPSFFTKQKGWLAIAELIADHSFISHLSGKYTIGMSLRHAHDDMTEEFANYQGYAALNQELYKQKFFRLITFSQVGYAPLKINDAPFFVSTGVVMKGMNHQRKSDEMGCGMAYVRLRNRPFKSETTVEGYYSLSISSSLLLKPDIQYIVHPSRTAVNIHNALVGMMRLQLKL